MASSIISSAFNSLEQWAVQRELAIPLEPARGPEVKEDYTAGVAEPTLLDRVVFGVCTGLDLKAIRELKVALTPRFEQLAHQVRNRTQRGGEANARVNMIRLFTAFHGAPLESYWLDREFSFQIKNLDALREYLKNQKLMDCEPKQHHPDDTSYDLSYRCPIEKGLASRAVDRLFRPEVLSPDSSTDYVEETDTFKLVPHGQGVTHATGNGSISFSKLYTCINLSLSKRLERDVKMRETNPDSPLEFVKNEIYEEALAKRRLLVRACWITSVALLALSTSVFLYCIARVYPTIRCSVLR